MQPGTTQEYEFHKALVLSLIRDADGIDTRQLIDKSELRENTVKRACSELKAAGRILGQFEERTPGLRADAQPTRPTGRRRARNTACSEILQACRRAAASRAASGMTTTACGLPLRSCRL